MTCTMQYLLSAAYEDIAGSLEMLEISPIAWYTSLFENVEMRISFKLWDGY